MNETARILALLLILVMAPIAGAQQQFAVLQKGFQSETLYQFGNVDNVNIFNGNLVIALPIGLEYPLNGGLSYQLQLSYNSKAWEFKPAGTVVWGRPTKRSNAGHGWTLGMGRFIAANDYARNSSGHNIYEAADGADHFFDDHGGAFTSDGSNLRLRVAGNNYEVDFPDGTIHKFSLVSGSSTEWELREIRAAGPLPGGGTPDSVTVERVSVQDAAVCPANTVFAWRISDSRLRMHYVCFKNYQVDGAAWPMVEKVVLAGPQNSTPTFSFIYASDQTVDKPFGDTDTNQQVNPQIHSVPLLTALQLPDNSTFEFSYRHPVNGVGGGSGEIKSLLLPTKGRIEYGYGSNEIPPLDLCASKASGLASSFGIATRTFYPAIRGGETGQAQQWEYENSVVEFKENAGPMEYVAVRNCGGSEAGDPNNPPSHPLLYDAMIVKVTDPAGHVVENFFSVWPGGDTGRLPDPNVSPAGVQRRHYGYPYGKYDAAQNRYLSQQFRPSENANVSRSVYVRHDSHPTQLHPDGDPEGPHTLASQRTVFHDDPFDTGYHSTTTEWTDWDGYGHYRTVATSGTFGGSPDKPRVVTTSWNKLNGTARTIGSNDQWILNAYESVTTTEGDSTVVEQACFDLSTGFLKARRQWAGSQPASKDLLAVFVAGADGNVQQEKYYGGDSTPLPTNAASQPHLCSALSNLGSPSYEIAHTWQNGQMASSQYAGMPFLSMDLTIDMSGLITKSRDTAGLETGYHYDSSGRLLSITPPGTAATTISYTNASSTDNGGSLFDDLTTPAKVTQSTGSSDAEVKTIYEFDSFGRVALQRQLMPDGTESARRTTYDVLGQKARESELEANSGTTFSPQHETVYSDYDAFGRVGLVTAPDNSTVKFTYTGIRQVVRETKGGGNVEPALNISATEIHDAFGRLQQIEENSGPNDERGITYYRYDAANRLSSVRMTNAATSHVQSRFFYNDGRGLLIWESQPESGMKSYTYDARGHARSIEFGAARTTFDQVFTYDAAERLVKVEARSPENPYTFRVFKEFEYGGANDPAAPDYRLGKLVTATRYNYPPEPNLGYRPETVRVREIYAYKDAAGRKTDRTTTIAIKTGIGWNEARSIKQSQSYDSLGQPSKMTYPMCEECGTPPGNPWVDITSAYKHGRITGMSDFVSNISYWPNGMRRVLHHTNGMEDTQEVDTTGMPRPGRLKSEVYKPCQAPTITSQTMGAVRGPSGGPVNLQVTATGTAELSYKWFNSTATPAILIGTGASFSVSDAGTYYAEVSNDCRTVRSKTITVKVGDCVSPWISEVTAMRNANGTYTLSGSAFGTSPLNYSWTRTADGTVVGNALTVTTAVLTESTQFTLTVSNSCGGPAASQSVTAEVPVTIAPMTLTIQRQLLSGGRWNISVSWPAVPGATSYAIYRRDIGGQHGPINTTAANFEDPNLAAGDAYAYQVLAHRNLTPIAKSAWTLTSTLSFTPVVAGVTDISAGVFNELLAGVNAVRATAGFLPVTWSNILSPNDPLPAPGTLVMARYLLAIRARLNEAFAALGIPSTSYTDPDVHGIVVQAIHINEIQGRLQ